MNWRGLKTAVPTGAALGSSAALLAAAVVSAAPPAAPHIGGFIGGKPATRASHFLQPTDVAVYRDPSDNPYGDKVIVTEGLASNSRVQRLDADGNFELSWGRDVVIRGPGDTPDGGFEICAAASSCGRGRSGGGPGELARPSGLAVHPATGDVYVVDAGNTRVQQFSIDGNPIRSWPLDIGDAASRFEGGPIAIATSEPYDVFVGDPTNRRVLQFSATGEFERMWGWGVSTGTRRFETCVNPADCRTGLPLPGLGNRHHTWPRHLAVDSQGILYGATFFAIVFDDGEVRAHVVRFDTKEPPDPPSAGGARLTPLRPYPGLWNDEPESALLTDGATLGLDVQPDSQRLYAINNPFGPSVLDVVERPAADGGRWPRVTAVSDLPFLQNVTGIATTEDLVLLSSGTVEEVTGKSGYTGCARDDTRHDCHGLIALADGGRARGAVAPGSTSTTLSAVLDPNGAVSYRFQISRDGRRWHDVSAPRYSLGGNYRLVRSPVAGLAPGVLYKTRVVMTKRATHGTQISYSGSGFVLGAS